MPRQVDTDILSVTHLKIELAEKVHATFARSVFEGPPAQHCTTCVQGGLSEKPSEYLHHQNLILSSQLACLSVG